MTESAHLLHFVLDLTSNLRFDRHRATIWKRIIQPILNHFKNSSKLCISFSAVHGSLGLGLHSRFLGQFTVNQNTFRQLELFFEKEIDLLMDNSQSGSQINGAFGVAAVIEAVSAALSLFDFSSEATHRHIIMLPTSHSSEAVGNFRTCPNDRYAQASISDLIAQLRGRCISLSMIGPDINDLSVLDHFLVFKCNEKFASPDFTLHQQLSGQLGPKWIIRLAGNLDESSSAPTMPPTSFATNSNSITSGSSSSSSGPTSPTSQRSLSDSEMITRTTLHLASLNTNDRMMALKTLLDPSAGTFPMHLRSQLTLSLKTHLEKTQQQQHFQAQMQMQAQMQIHQASQPASPLRRRPSQSNIFWSGVVKFMEKQRTFQFQTQFVLVDGQPAPPRPSLENWPTELNLTGLLDTKKESIQAGLSAGYAFRVVVNPGDAPVASYLMTRMSQHSGAASVGPLACLRVSTDVLVMLRVISMESLQLVGYLIDRRYPKQMSISSQASLQTSFQVNKSLPPKPVFSALSAGMEGLNLHGLQLPANGPKTAPPRRASVVEMKPQARPQQQQSFTVNRLQHQPPQPQPRNIPAAQPAPATVLTDPHAILQKLKGNASQSLPETPISVTPKLQPNAPAHPEWTMDEPLDESFVDAWLN